jgi:hypothetical protein
LVGIRTELFKEKETKGEKEMKQKSLKRDCQSNALPIELQPQGSRDNLAQEPLI